MHITKYMSNKTDANVIGVYSMSRNLNYDRTDHLRKVDSEGTPLGSVKEMSPISKSMLCVMGVSTDGYIRLYRVREQD